MRTTTQLSVTLPNEMAEAVKTRVASGEYASESEVIRDGLRALLARDAAMEHWLRTEVVAAYDELEADPTKAITSTQLRQRLARRQSERIYQGLRWIPENGWHPNGTS